MKKRSLVILAVTCALAMPLVGCDSSRSSTDNSGTDSSTEQSADFDYVDAYYGQWRGSVATTGTSVYGTTGGSEQMLDINLEEDGTCTVEPLDTHPDLLSDSGTWDGTEDTITLHLDGAGDITLNVTGSATAEGTASDFDIADFDTIQFDFYG